MRDRCFCDMKTTLCLAHGFCPPPPYVKLDPASPIASPTRDRAQSLVQGGLSESRQKDRFDPGMGPFSELKQAPPEPASLATPGPWPGRPTVL